MAPRWEPRWLARFSSQRPYPGGAPFTLSLTVLVVFAAVGLVLALIARQSEQVSAAGS